jgi:hypothetical protein
VQGASGRGPGGGRTSVRPGVRKDGGDGVALNVQAVEAAVAGLRQGIEADGAALEVEGVDGGLVRFRLVFGPETCRECMLPPEMLEPLLAGCLEDLATPAPRVAVTVVED